MCVREAVNVWDGKYNKTFVWVRKLAENPREELSVCFRNREREREREKGKKREV